MLLTLVSRTRSAILSNRHELPFAIHRALQVPHTRRRPVKASLDTIDTLAGSKTSSAQKSYAQATRLRAATPEARRPAMLQMVDEITKPTTQGGLGIGKRDHVVSLGRGMFVPVELIAQMVREKFWHRI